MEPKNKIMITSIVTAILIGIVWFLNDPDDSKVSQNQSDVSLDWVTIKTDKAEYSQGETITTIVSNGLNVPILYSGWGGRFWGIQYFENNTWKNYADEDGFQLANEEVNAVCYMRLYERMPPDNVDAGKTVSHAWNQRICPYGDGNPSKPNFVKYVGLGRYKLTFNYGFEVSGSDSFNIADIKTVYSDEFTIQ